MTLNDLVARQEALRDVLAELVVWPSREREGAFRSWLRRSFSLVHLRVLTLLESHGPLSVSKLADALDVSVPAATGTPRGPTAVALGTPARASSACC